MCQPPLRSIPISITSWPDPDRASETATAEMQETSCSAERPPKSKRTRAMHREVTVERARSTRKQKVDDVIDRDVFLGYRLFAVRMGLALSWLGTFGFIWVANRGPGPIAPGATTEIMALAAMTVLLTFAPWQSVLAGEFGDAYIGIWSVVTVGGLIAVHDLSSGLPFSVAFIVVVVFAAATLVRSGYLTLIAASALAGYALALDRAGADLSSGGTRLRLVGFAVAALLAIAASVGVTRVFRSAARRLRDLESQSADIEQQRVELNELYAISGTIGLGGTLAEIMPVLMGRIVNSVGARVGLVFLFRPDHDDLELISAALGCGSDGSRRGLHTSPHRARGRSARVHER